MKTFPMGGVHPSENKLSCAKPIEVLPLPDVVTIPLAQHIGAPKNCPRSSTRASR